MFTVILLSAIFSPVLDLLLFKLIATLFTISIETLNQHVWELFVGLVLLAMTNASLKYFIKIKKIEFINVLINVINDTAGAVLKSSINWLRMAFLETINISLVLSNILIISIFSFYLNLYLGGSLTFVFLSVFLVCSFSFNKEQLRQIKIRFNKRLKAKERGERNVLSRVKSSEKVVFIVNVFIFLFFIVLIALYLNGYSDAENSLIFLFITRILGSNLSNFVGALMRLARAWANIFDRYAATLDFFIKN